MDFDTPISWATVPPDDSSTDAPRNKVILVGLSSPVLGRAQSADSDTMDELAALAQTAGASVEGTLIQNRHAPDPGSFIGEGKIAEVKLWCENTGADMVIFDNDLSPSQMRVLTERLGVQVLDRCGLIQDIFAQRARTREGRLQVELAQYQPILAQLISDAMMHVEGSKSYIVHVSKEDYPEIGTAQRTLLEESAPGCSVDVVEDIGLSRNQCMLETDNGVFDVGLDRQLTELRNKLMILSYSAE